MKKPEIIAIGADHAGTLLKDSIKRYLEAQQVRVIDLGTEGPTSVDYPDFAYKVAEAVKTGEAERGILICGSGIGMSIAANRDRAIRAALCITPEMAMLSRQHNDANIVVLGARLTDETTALECVKLFLSTEFEGGRHSNRIAKIS